MINPTEHKAKIELTDKQIMRTQLEAEKDLAEDMVAKADYFQSMYKKESERCDALESKNYHLRCLLKGLL